MAISDPAIPADLVELEIGPPGNGGFCIARHEGRVVFVRHTLPGERVLARITEDAGSYLRADAVTVLTASADRVEPPCPHSGPGRCGGCDWQHASGTAQRALKDAVVREQFTRLAKLEIDGLLSGVEELPGGLLGWRTRITYAVAPDGTPGLRRHRSHDVEPLGSCPLGVPGVGDTPALRRNWPGASGIAAVVGDDAEVTLLEHRPPAEPRANQRRGTRARQPRRGVRRPDRIEVVNGPQRVHQRVGERAFEIDANGFWQVHPQALPVLASALLDATAPQAGETVLELYAGAGPLTAVLADAVGGTGRVVGVESSRIAVADAQRNLADLPWAEVVTGHVAAGFVRDLGVDPDLVVLDPPRTGAGADLMLALIALGPRAIGYVSCDPATLARDVRAAMDEGWELTGLRAFDAFPMTQHVECLALLTPSDQAKPHAPRIL